MSGEWLHQCDPPGWWERRRSQTTTGVPNWRCDCGKTWVWRRDLFGHRDWLLHHADARKLITRAIDEEAGT